MFCSGCGRQMDAGEQFCPGCGLKNPAPQSTSMVASAGTGVAPAQIPAQQIIVVAEKSPGLAAVLSFFWAGLGADIQRRNFQRHHPPCLLCRLVCSDGRRDRLCHYADPLDLRHG